MVSVSNTRWSGGTYVKNGILRSGTIPGKDENGNWSAPHGVEFDIEKGQPIWLPFPWLYPNVSLDH